MTQSNIVTLFADLALIIFVAQLAGRAARALGQPAVLGEIVAGILMGPTLLDGAVAAALFPVEVRPHLSALADVGLVLFMFVVGLEFDFERLRGFGRVTGTTAVSASLLPFALGCGLALYLFETHPAGNRLHFVLFFGVAMSITAFPVLARILVDHRMNKTLVGAIALSAAAVCDLAGWSMLALVQALAGGKGTGHWLVLLIVPFAAVLVFVVRPLLKRLFTRGAEGRGLTTSRFAAVLACLFASAAVTELIGLHFVFGAFLFGLVMPREATERTRLELLERSRTGTSFLLPVYFVVAGLNVDLATMGFTGLLELGLILVTAVVGKTAGTFVTARTEGMSTRRSGVLATLMNTRGLTELIVLGIGLNIGILDDALYAQMVVMAVVTTAMTGVLLRWLVGRDDRNPPEQDALPLRDGEAAAARS
ncbi:MULTISPECIES: cation:proton antiporter domain-containing protein [unclassified Streptomyces]|uniref:cation:proton antiporter domain-containing protein n=1 Tax=Streptomyces sp. NRRL F-4428 TaxID=1609137 RepID=UPI00099BCC1E|nr:cation:proton antiporter [Streptomyces sp. NRRL F-4428]